MWSAMMMSQTIQVHVHVHVLSANALYYNTLAMHVVMSVPVSTNYENSMNHGFITSNENIFYSCRDVVWGRRFYVLEMSPCTEAVHASRYRLTREMSLLGRRRTWCGYTNNWLRPP
jgi:hypothetical protein